MLPHVLEYLRGPPFRAEEQLLVEVVAGTERPLVSGKGGLAAFRLGGKRVLDAPRTPVVGQEGRIPARGGDGPRETVQALCRKGEAAKAAEFLSCHVDKFHSCG